MVTTRPMSTTNTATAVPAVNRNYPYHGYARPLMGNGIAVFFFNSPPQAVRRIPAKLSRYDLWHRRRRLRPFEGLSEAHRSNIHRPLSERFSGIVP